MFSGIREYILSYNINIYLKIILKQTLMSSYLKFYVFSSFYIYSKNIIVNLFYF